MSTAIVVRYASSASTRRAVLPHCAGDLRPLSLEIDQRAPAAANHFASDWAGGEPPQPRFQPVHSSGASEMADILTLKKFAALSPFEIKDELINLAKETSKRTQSAFLNAGRGNPNWIATKPREGFFLLGQFAITESKLVMHHPAGVGGMPQAKGIAGRLEAWLAKHADMPG